MSGGFGGIVLRFGGGDPLDGRSVSSQTAPAGFYVYGHFDSAGKMFYVGRGNKRRAWDLENRHVLWHRYVTKNLQGQFGVRILADELTEEEAVDLESELMMQSPDGLVNWVNWGRHDDYEAIDRFHRLRDANRARVAQGNTMEKTDLDGAIRLYKEAIQKTAEYASIQFETGLVGQLRREEREEFGVSGEVQALERLVMCLLKTGDVIQADTAVEEYFKLYPLDSNLCAAERTRARIQKAHCRARG